MYDVEKIHRILNARVDSYVGLCNASKQSELIKLKELSRAVRNSPTIANLLIFEELEKKTALWSCYSPTISSRYKLAIDSGRATSSQSYQSSNNPKAGWIYILTDKSKPLSLKIGFTAQKITDRLDQLRKQYPTAKIIHHKLVNDPREVELKVHKKLQKYRLSSNAAGESNEWFNIKPAYAKRIITMTINEFKKDSIFSFKVRY